ncbi:MAG: S41 family peptidase [Chlamydiota bacterium]|nr:S41 family peptidase [Chlamydiota bacterium]
MFKYTFYFLVFLTSITGIQAKLPDLTPEKTVKTSNDMLQLHASHTEITPELMKRIFQNFLEELDPAKTYLIKSDINTWLEPSDEILANSITQYKNGNFVVFDEMYEAMVCAIDCRSDIDRELDIAELPKKVDPTEFKDMQWVENKEELQERLKKIRSLQIETASKLNEELKEKSLQRIAKRQSKNEEEIINPDKKHRQKLILTKILKATASALDTHTAYFTPEEAKQFMINVQQRLYGIGAQLRDDVSGFSVVKIVEGGPAYNGKELKAGDRIIAVDGEPVVGMGIEEAVELIRGEENTPVILTVIREEGEEDNKVESKLDITITRGEVVLKEARFESSYEPFGDGVIAYLKLHTFYQDPESASAIDLTRELEKIKADNKVKGVVLDLRYNSGGMLSQAVAVTGLFITKGVVVSIKDNTGHVQHLRDLDGKSLWDGPLVVLVNKASASASEIVAQTLQDYGRAIIVGDESTFGKGSFQTFTLNSQSGEVNPDGEYKVTRGRYYTVSGKTPQLSGVKSDVVLAGPLSEVEIGEQYAKYPLEGDKIKENFDDDLSDVPFLQRDRIRMLYKFNLQPKLTRFTQHLDRLQGNSDYRIANNKNYQSFLKELKKKKKDIEENDEEEFGQNDLQLTEAVNIIKDLIVLDELEKPTKE